MPTDNFDDIRPYRDAEVCSTVARLLDDTRLMQMIGQVKFPCLYRYSPQWPRNLFLLFIQRLLSVHLSKLQTVDDVQNMMFVLMVAAIAKTTSGVSYSGSEQLDRGKSCLFLSNHRDIAMDPAFVNYALKVTVHGNVEIAIGDNLLSDPLVADIMRLNRSSAFNRSVEGLKARLLAFNRLSAYISQTLSGGRSICLA